MNPAINIGAYLKEIRMKQTDLSIKTGISCPKLSLAFSGKRRLSLQDISNICFILNKTPNDFIVPEAPDFVKN